MGPGQLEARALRARQDTTAPATTGSSGGDATSTAAAALVTAESIDAAGNVKVVTAIITVPPWTATRWSAYDAPGVNTTHKGTTSTISPIYFPGLVQTETQTKSTPTHQAPGAWATHKGIAKNVLTKCSIDGKNDTWGPFCSPNFQQNLWIGFTYAFTWNSDLYPLNATNRIQMQYADESLGNATVSDPIPNYLGYQNITMDEAWLQGAAGNDTESGRNFTLRLIVDPAGSPPQIVAQGPHVQLVRDPASLPKYRVHVGLPTKLGLEIGLPIGLVAAIIIFFSLWCTFRQKGRRWQDVRGAGRDYMAKRARRRGHAYKGGDIQLGEVEVGSDDTDMRYTDQPVTGGGNAFRDEIRRQREEDDASLKRTVSSY